MLQGTLDDVELKGGNSCAMLRTHIDATHGSDALKSGALQKAISVLIEKFKPEATYFGLESGQRTAFFVFDMEGSHQCPRGR